MVNETRFIAGLPFDQHNIQLGGGSSPRQTHDRRTSSNWIQLHREASPKFRGIRKMAAVHPDKGIHAWTDEEPHLYRNKNFLKGFEELAKQDLSFDAWVYSPHITADVTALAKDFPNTPIVLDHLGTSAGLFGKVGKATGKTEQSRAQIFADWKDQLTELSECQNVSNQNVSSLYARFRS